MRTGARKGRDMSEPRSIIHTRTLYSVDPSRNLDRPPCLFTPPPRWFTPHTLLLRHHSRYTDTNFVLCGLVVEAVTQQPLHVSLRESLFAPLGMTHTYMSYREVPPPGPLAHRYARDRVVVIAGVG